MPYIKPEEREKLDQTRPDRIVNPDGDWIPDSPGELNYVLTRTVIDYIKDNGPLNYQRINDVMGALEGAKQEFYRRVAAPYENSKIDENGDVYPEEIAPRV